MWSIPTQALNLDLVLMTFVMSFGAERVQIEDLIKEMML